MSSKCAFMLCSNRPRGMVVLNAFTADGTATRVEVPMCVPCSNELERAIRDGHKPHVTPGMAIYLGDLNAILPRPPR
jgi:hypothetical protein